MGCSSIKGIEKENQHKNHYNDTMNSLNSLKDIKKSIKEGTIEISMNPSKTYNEFKDEINKFEIFHNTIKNPTLNQINRLKELNEEKESIGFTENDEKEFNKMMEDPFYIDVLKVEDNISYFKRRKDFLVQTQYVLVDKKPEKFINTYKELKATSLSFVDEIKNCEEILKNQIDDKNCEFTNNNKEGRIKSLKEYLNTNGYFTESDMLSISDKFIENGVRPEY